MLFVIQACIAGKDLRICHKIGGGLALIQIVYVMEQGTSGLATLDDARPIRTW